MVRSGNPFRLKSAVLALAFAALPLLHAQSGSAYGETDPASLIGSTLEELIRRFGTPKSVYAVRGLEEWQDDVVFVYDHGDYYVFRDRVWQAGFKSARGIKAGDSRAVVSLVLGARAENRGNSVFLSLDEGSWPLMLRCDFDRDGRALVIFIYRTDF
jgi:hypothetical protein